MEEHDWEKLEGREKLKLLPFLKEELLGNSYKHCELLNRDRQRYYWYNDKTEYEYLLKKHNSNNRHYKDNGNHLAKNTFTGRTSARSANTAASGGSREGAKGASGKGHKQAAPGLFD